MSVSMSIGMHHLQLYSLNEIPGYFQKGTYPPKQEKRSHIGRALTRFIRLLTPSGGRSSPQLRTRMMDNTMEGDGRVAELPV